ncbi:MAG: aldo/keto reductase [Bacteriovoracaceae bacterium]
MKQINELSAIGFGSYRVSVKSQTHENALIYALKNGVNLIDTSANYTNGDSEKLIGKVLSTFPQFDPFIVTKGGYVQGKNLEVMRELNFNNKAVDDLVFLDPELMHSIHPEFLEKQIEISLKQMNRTQIDCYLLHNPEYYFEDQNNLTSSEEYYKRIKKAFTFLEEKVQQKKIRYYGISSNNFPYSDTNPKVTNLQKVLDIADEVSSNHHFKFIQFPYNFMETGVLQNTHNGLPVLNLAKKNQLVTLVNRPLNAFSNSGLLRLATYEKFYQDLNDSESDRHFEFCNNLIYKKCLEIEPLSKDDFATLPLIKQLRDVWKNLQSIDAVDQVFWGHLFPFLVKMWGGDSIPADESKPFYYLYDLSCKYALKNMTAKTIKFKNQLIQQDLINSSSTHSLAHDTIKIYLKSGLDHILVGMRKQEYVEDLIDLVNFKIH